jgi:hypothetical protein
MPDPIHPEIRPAHDAEELLPWYATGQLEGAELARVQQHLSGCAHCRRQLAFERRMVDEFALLTPEIEAGWARLRDRLEPVGRSPVSVGLWNKISNDFVALWEVFSRPPIAALAVAQLAFVVLAGSLLLSLSRPTYRALGSAPPPPSANVIAMFRSDMTESQITDLLRTNDASLVGGPTSTDAYLLRVPAGSRQLALTRLRDDRHVLLAQPIDGSTP